MPHFISPHFTEEEFRCKCGCMAYAVDYNFIIRLEDARERSGIPYVIRSGCRCPEHNREVGGKPDSAHVTRADDGEFCQAADVETSTSFSRFRVVSGLLAAGFTRLGWGPDFIHVDADKDKPQNVFFRE